MKKDNTPVAELSYDEAERILHIKLHDGARMDMENTRVHYDKINKLVAGKDYLALVDATNHYTVEKDAWYYASQKEIIANRKAIAHYNSSAANKLTTSVFKSLYNTSMPLQIFETKEQALKWLKTFAAECRN